MEYTEYIEIEMMTPVPRALRERSDPMTMWNDEEFVDRFRFSKWAVIDLLEKLESELIPPANNRGLPIPPLMKILVTLRFYASGLYHRENSDLLGISESATCRVIHDTTKAICSLRPDKIRFPNPSERGKCKLDFFSIANFPGKQLS